MNHSATEHEAGEVKWTPSPQLLDFACDDAELIGSLIDVFKTDTAAHLQRMHAAVATVDISVLQAKAHSIKGSSWQVGADALAEACQALELACTHAPVSRLAVMVDHIQDLFAEISSAMTAYSHS